MKKGFIIYKSLYEPIKALSREQKGELLEAIFEYQTNSLVLEEMNPIVEMAFMFFKNQFDIDQEKYEEKCAKARESVNKRWERTNTNVYERIESNTNHTDKREKIEEKREKEKVESKEKEESITKRYHAFVSWFNDSMISVKGRKGAYKPTTKLKPKFETALKEGYTFEDFRTALKNMVTNPYHIENKFQYITPEFLCRTDKLERFINIVNPEQEKRIEDLGASGKGGVSLYGDDDNEEERNQAIENGRKRLEKLRGN